MITSMKTCHQLSLGLAALCLLAWFCPQSGAANISWNAESGNWGDPTNWSPNSVPGASDSAFIGNLAGAENDTVFLNSDEEAASLQVTDGMRVQANGSLLEISGDLFISGSNLVEPVLHPSSVSANDGFGSTVLNVGDDLTLEDGGTLSIRDSSRVIIGDLVDINSSSAVRGEGSLWLMGNGSKSLINDGVIDPSTGGMSIVQFGSGLIDLDGNAGNGRLAISASKIDGSAADNLTIVGIELADAFNGDIGIAAGGFLLMSLDNGWTAGVGSEISLHGSSADPVDPGAKIRGSHVTLAGDLIVSGFDALGIITADATFESTASVQVGTNDILRVEGETQINGGEFTLNEDALLRFDGPTTVEGGTFNTHSPLSSDGSVNFNGPTDWDGTVTINGIARQNGDADVVGPTTIQVDVLDMDGAGGTTWNVGNGLVINAGGVDSTISNSFDGVMNISGGFASMLTINLSDPADHWTMAGEMNLSNLGFVPFSVNRVAGSLMRVTGQLNVSNLVRISAPTTFDNSSETNLPAATDRLTMSGPTSVRPGATFNGVGTLINSSDDGMTLEDSVSLDLVGLINAGHLEIGDSPGIADVDRFENTANGTWLVEIGGHVAGTEYDRLIVSGSDAILAGLIEVDLIDAGAGLFQPEIGDQFTVLTSLGDVIDTFENEPVSMAAGKQFHWSVIYNPHDVILELASITVPEPATLALSLLGLLSILVLRRSN
jgi:hypothetical protein